MKNIYNLFVLSGALLMTASGCYNDNIESLYPTSNGCDTSNVSYTNFVKPILDNKCLSCHNQTLPSGGVDLSTYEKVKIESVQGALLGSIKQNGTAAAMPVGSSKLDDCTISKIQSWVNAGAQNN